MEELQQHILESITFIRRTSALEPEIALVLGSGLGEFADSVNPASSIPTPEIPHYPRSTVAGHKGRLILGTLRGKSVVALQGRVHFYESGSADSVRYPVRTVHALGAKVLIVTNAAGGVNRDYVPGDLMLIADQMNLAGRVSPLPERDRHQGPVYDVELLRLAEEASERLGMRVRRGVYAGMRGPSYETGAEVEMVHRLGSDAVGMSTVLEVELAVSLGMRVLGISCITNKATGVGDNKLNHDEVTVVANRVKDNFGRLLTEIIGSL